MTGRAVLYGRALRAPLALLTCCGILAAGACDDRVHPTGLTQVLAYTQSAAGPIVNSLSDPGDGTCDDTECTLREAIAFASDGGEITFDVTGTIVLAGAELVIDKTLLITGPGASSLTVSGNGASRVFNITSTGNANIYGLTIADGLVSGSTGWGGGIYSEGPFTLALCVVTGNRANEGGGLYIDWHVGPVLVTHSTISGNVADTYGGGLSNSGALTLAYSTVSGNEATHDGGGIESMPDHSDMTTWHTTILNSTISGNTAGNSAGGFDAWNGLSRIVHSTITANSVSALGYGGGVMSSNDDWTFTEIKGSIVWGNRVGTSSQDLATYWGPDHGYDSYGYNLIGTANEDVDLAGDFDQTGDQIGVTDAMLGSLELNAPGVTATHALLTGSPALDQGICTDLAGNTVTTDQRGVGRPQGAQCDIGAYELEVGGGTTTPEFAFDLSSLPAKTYGDASFFVQGYVTTNSGGTVSFATGTGSVGCSVTPAGSVTITGAATGSSYCILEATLAADATYTGAGPISQQFNIAKASTTVTIANMPASASVGGGFTPTYTTASDGATSVVSNTTGVCTVSGGDVSFIAMGTCTLVASVAEGTNWLAATGTDQSVTVGAATPTFAFDLGALPEKTYGDADFGVAAYVTTNSSGTVSFATGAGSTGCSVTPSGTVTITGAATGSSYCVLEATLAADATYAGAGPISQQFNIAKAAVTVAIANMPASAAVGGGFTPTYTTVSDGATSAASNTPGVCTVSGGDVSFVGTGTCTLVASVAEGTNWLPATGSDQSVTVGPGTPNFTFDLSSLPARTYGDADFSVRDYVTTNSTGEVAFASGAGSVGCSVTPSGTVTLTGAATGSSYCIVEATLAADANYTGAGPISQQFNIAKAEPTVAIANMPGSVVVGEGFTPMYTTVSDGATSVVSSTPGVCTVSGGDVSFVAEGTCILVASVAEGTNWLPTTGSDQSVAVGPASSFTSVCTYAINPKNERRTVTITWENAEPGVTLILVSDGKDAERQMHPTASGSWSTGLEDGTPTYGLWGGLDRKDDSVELVPASTPCTPLS